MTFLPTNPFLGIITGKTPTKVVYETDTVMAFYDIAPQAKTHILIIPKRELVTAKDMTADDAQLMGELILASKVIAEELGLEGYKLHMNVGEAGGQVVPHVHLHMLSSDYASSL